MKADIKIPIAIDGMKGTVYVRKRPGVDQFLEVMAQHFEVVIFTASMSVYADAVLDTLDPNGFCTARLYREHCTPVDEGGRGPIYTKDMSKIGRSPQNAMLLDNSPDAYMMQPEQAIPVTSWYHDKKDRELFDLTPLLIKMSKVDDVRDAITEFVVDQEVDF